MMRRKSFWISQISKFIKSSPNNADQQIYSNCRRKAIMREKLDSFGQKFLVALREVEDAVVLEGSQIELLNQINKLIEIAQLYLEEARVRYANGLNDYLTVIAGIQSLQRLERRMIVEHRILLTTRSNLYRSLGGTCLVTCCRKGTCEEAGCTDFVMDSSSNLDFNEGEESE